MEKEPISLRKEMSEDATITHMNGRQKVFGEEIDNLQNVPQRFVRTGIAFLERSMLKCRIWKT